MSFEASPEPATVRAQATEEQAQAFHDMPTGIEAARTALSGLGVEDPRDSDVLEVVADNGLPIKYVSANPNDLGTRLKEQAVEERGLPQLRGKEAALRYDPDFGRKTSIRVIKNEPK